MIKKILILLLILILIFLSGLSGCRINETESETSATIEEAETKEAEESIEAVDEESVQEGTEETTEEIELQVSEGEVYFKTEDGTGLNGNIFGTGNRWVILSHMYPTDQTSWFDFARYLADNGYTALTYDFRGYGKSGGIKDVGNIDKDLEAALVFIRQYNTEKIFLMGASMGGTASLVVASKQTVNGVISLSSPVEWQGLSALDAVVKIDAPKLFIASRGDVSAAESARALNQAASDPKSLSILDGSAHGTYIFDQELDNTEIVKQIVLDFLNDN